MAGFRRLGVAAIVAGMAYAGMSHAAVYDLNADLSSADWLAHLNDDLLGYWDDATADPATQSGSMPYRLCNDGSLVTYGVACEGVTLAQSKAPVQTVVGQSRQVYSYALAFHMTGNTEYLDLAKAGYEYLISPSTFYDDTTGLYRTSYNVATGAQSGLANVQQQAYALLGQGFLAYVTGDASIQAQTAAGSAAIMDRFGLQDASGSFTGSFAQTVDGTDAGPNIVMQLDQLNAYKVLLAQTSDGAAQANVLQEALATARYLREEYFDTATGLMREQSYSSGISISGYNYGLSAKAFWFIDQLAQQAGDAELSAWAQDAARKLFVTAYDADLGAWRTSQDLTGVASDTLWWWEYAELDQYASQLAVSDPVLAQMVESAQSFWLDNFVDHRTNAVGEEYGGVFPSLVVSQDSLTGEYGVAADTNAPKHYQWIAGFHAFEHALVSYMSEAMASGEAITLYFADAASDFTLAYGMQAQSQTVEQILSGTTTVYAVTYTGLSYALASAIPAVPLPAGGLLLLSGLAALCLHKRRRRLG
ncbi:VPLPA-CTERM sorting domain-containing protein [Thioclava kandeliae]|uniref:VPLPA-CTERM sorting domain-containing protein n=1 Tax=Thioclava kandeliae TaxID=3070818 RepID=A0ABV1SLS3_9RHOB